MPPLALEDTLLTSERLVLRAFRPAEDAAELAAPITPAILHFLNWDGFGGEAGFAAVCKDWAEKMRAGSAVVLVVRDRAQGALVGMAGLRFLDRQEPTAGLWIRDGLQGQGYGGEAMRALAHWAFRNRKAKGIYLPVFDSHEPSRRIAEGLGGAPAVADPKTQAPDFAGSMVLYRIPHPAVAVARI